MAATDFFIKAIPMVDLQGSTSIPTVLFYEGKNKYLVGFEAKAACEAAGREALNEDFKIDIGNEDPSFGTKKRLFPTADGGAKSAGELAGDFFGRLLGYVREWLSNQNLAADSGIVVAEPFSIDENREWRKHYRDTIRRILLGKGFTEGQIDFLPEPFAVFQYYKYGVKHPLLGSSKHIALVLDFGGGSFDVSVVETDREGTITTKKTNTRPKGCESVSVGGYYVNRVIAEKLFRKYLKEDRDRLTNINNGLQVYRDWRKGGNIRTVKDKLQRFVRNFHNTIYEVEEPKIALCNLIPSWDLDAHLGSLSVPVRLPRDPFEDSPQYFQAQLTATELRDLFVTSVWKTDLEPAIKRGLRRAADAYEGSAITVVLLSGGSCNIRWLPRLLKRNFGSELSKAHILELDEDFQEVVAKGLAIESAIRFHDPEKAGDFTSVTYNSLNLVLDPDEVGFQLKLFKPSQQNPISPSDKRCVLLPAASVLRNQFDKPLTWSVKLDKPPKRSLDYYFLRAGLSPFSDEVIGDAASGELNKYSSDLLNLDHRVSTPPNCSFAGSMEVELKIEKETKTARVKFIYSRDAQNRPRHSVEGRPFYIDVTDTNDKALPSYVGLDFGTSNTSASYINVAAIRTYERRSSDRNWREVSDLHTVLPYPLSAPLAKYLRSYDRSNLVDHALEFTEAALALAAYVAYLEVCLAQQPATSLQTAYFAKFSQRSVGPLWRFLKKMLTVLGSKAQVVAPFSELVEEPFFQEIENGVEFFNQKKHHKENPSNFNPRVVNILANVSQKVFSDYRFGFFENVQRQGLGFTANSYKGRFRLACGSNINFVESEEYIGKESFPARASYLVNFERRTALSLYPLIFWWNCSQHGDLEHCFVYDKHGSVTPRCESISYKAADFTCSLSVDPDHEHLREVHADVARRLQEDIPGELISF